MGKVQIQSFGVHKTSLVIACVYFVISLLFVPFIFMAASENHALPVFLYFLPVFYGLLGYLITALGCWIYNLIAKKIGGIEVITSEVEK